VCQADVWAYLDLEYDECDTCDMTKEEAIKLYPKKNKHLQPKEKKE